MRLENIRYMSVVSTWVILRTCSDYGIDVVIVVDSILSKSIGFSAGILLVMAAGNLTFKALPGFCIALANTFGDIHLWYCCSWNTPTHDYCTELSDCLGSFVCVDELMLALLCSGLVVVVLLLGYGLVSPHEQIHAVTCAAFHPIIRPFCSTVQSNQDQFVEMMLIIFNR